MVVRVHFREKSTLTPVLNYSPKSPTEKHDGVREPLVGSDVLDVVQGGRGDLSDWVELMEAVEASCPVWPRGNARWRSRSSSGFEEHQGVNFLCPVFDGVPGAMDTIYQRGKIQDESMYYEHKKHDGSLPLIGVNTFLPKEHAGEIATEIELIRSTEEEKGAQIANVKLYGEARNSLAADSLKVLQTTARERRNVFEQLIEAVKYNSLGQISHALYEVGGIGGICRSFLGSQSRRLFFIRIDFNSQSKDGL